MFTTEEVSTHSHRGQSRILPSLSKAFTATLTGAKLLTTLALKKEVLTVFYSELLTRPQMEMIRKCCCGLDLFPTKWA